AAHAAGATRAAAGACGLGFFLDLSHESLGGEHEAGDGRGVLQRKAGDLRWIDNAHLDHIAVVARFRVEPIVLVLGFTDFADHDCAFKAGVVRDLASGLFESALHDADADELIAIGLDLVNGGDGAEQGRAAAGNNAFLYGCLGRVHGVFYSSLLFLQLGFSRSANLDPRYTAHELS